MTRFRIPCFVLFALCVLTIQTQTAAETTTTPVLILPASVRFTAGDGVEVIVRGVDPTTRQLSIEIRGANVTGLPRGFPVTVHFDTNIVHVLPVETSAGLIVETASGSQTATWFLARSPFMPPTAWHYTVRIQLDRLPTAGHIAAGSDEVRQVTYGAVPALTPATHPVSKSSM